MVCTHGIGAVGTCLERRDIWHSTRCVLNSRAGARCNERIFWIVLAANIHGRRVSRSG